MNGDEVTALPMDVIEFMRPTKSGNMLVYLTMDELRAEIKAGHTLSHVYDCVYMGEHTFAKVIMRKDTLAWKALVEVPDLPMLEAMPFYDALYPDYDKYVSVVKNAGSYDGRLKYATVMGVVPFTKCMDEAPDKFEAKVFSRFAYDIEIDDKVEGLDWPTFKAPITYMSLSNGKDVRIVLANETYTAEYKAKLVDGVKILYMPDSTAMVVKFFELLETYKPHVLLSWNGYTFDVAVLMAHAPASYERKFMALSAKSFEGWTFCLDWGVHIDLYRMMDKNSRRAFSGLSLKVVSKELGLDSKLAMPKSANEVEAFIAYNIRDSDLVVAIDEVMDVTKGMISNAALSRSSWLCMVKNATAASVSTMYAYLARLKGKRVYFHEGSLKYSISCEKYAGAMVLEPAVGKHMGPIVCVDINALYPSIMVGTNIGPNTSETFEHFTEVKAMNSLLAANKDKRPIVGRPYLTDKFMFVVVNTDGLLVVSKRKHVVVSEMAEMVTYLMSSRDAVRAKMKAMDPDSAEYKTAYWIQWALKTMTVSVYGALGSRTSWISNRSLAELVTSVGRYCLIRALKFFESKGATVLYGDTDSLYMQMDGTVSEALAKVAIMCEDFTSVLSEESGLDTIKFKIEKVAKSMLLVRKKKYAMYAASVEAMDTYEDTSGLKYKTSFVGLSTIRKDFPYALRSLCEALINDVLSCETLSKHTIKARVEEFWQDIAKGKIEAKALCREVRDQMGTSLVYTSIEGESKYLTESTSASEVSRVWLAKTAGKLMDPILAMCDLECMATYAPMEKVESKSPALRVF